jgi:hypothetical protein
MPACADSGGMAPERASHPLSKGNPVMASKVNITGRMTRVDIRVLPNSRRAALRLSLAVGFVPFRHSLHLQVILGQLLHLEVELRAL